MGSNISEGKLSQGSKLKIRQFQNPETTHYDVCPRDRGTRAPREARPRTCRRAPPETRSVQWAHEMEHSYGWSMMREFKRIEISTK